MNRQDLVEYKENKRWIEARKESIENEYESVQRMIVKYQAKMKGSVRVQDEMAESLAILLDMKIEALNFAIKLEQDLSRIDRALLKIGQPYRNILTEVYVNGDSLVTVANHMNYNYKYMCVQHGKALKMYDNLKDVDKSG